MTLTLKYEGTVVAHRLLCIETAKNNARRLARKDGLNGQFEIWSSTDVLYQTGRMGKNGRMKWEWTKR